MVVGTAARCGSGQDVLADAVCEKYGFCKYSMGDILREECYKSNLIPTRENLQKIKSFWNSEYGNDYVSYLICNKINASETKNAIVTGIRTKDEYNFFKNKFNMKMIFVFAEEPIRIERILKRAEVKDEKTVEAIKEQFNKEEVLFDYDYLAQVSSYIFDFNMDLSKFLLQKDDILATIFRNLGETRK